MRQGNHSRPKAIAAVAMLAIVTATCAVADAQVTLTSGQILEPAVYQGPEMSPPANGGARGAGPGIAGPMGMAPAAGAADSSNSLRVVWQQAPVVPPQSIEVAPPPAPVQQPVMNAPNGGAAASPFVDGNAPTEEMMPPVVPDDSNDKKHIAVKPYGGGHPDDWSWGCGGSPYRTGPGLCDNWRVGPRWHVTVDGLVWHRDATDLGMLIARMPNSFPTSVPTQGINADVGLEQFSWGPGGRITFASQIARCTGYDLQAVYEGVNDWNSSIVYAKEPLPDVAVVIPPVPDTWPPGTSFPEGFQQRSLHYQSTLNSGELNFLKNWSPEWRPYCGVRYIRVDEQINDVLDQERQVPLAGPRNETVVPIGGGTNIAVTDPLGPTFETDRINKFDVENNLMGFQVGLLHDTIRLNNRFAFEGFVNSGVYYNQVKYRNTMGIFTTQSYADNIRSEDTDESRVDTSNIVNHDARDFADIAYSTEASLTGVCRLNKCWALRAGYQVLWLANVHTADDAYVGSPSETNNMLYHGWHAGVECRR
ncbi:MAG: hypothetical protein U0805_02595 [Pirellulales bacterium]